MPAPFGVTPEGFNAPTVEEIIALNEADEHAEIDDQLDVSTDTLVGKLNAIYARHLAVAWQALQAAYHSNDPERAVNAALTAIGKLTGTTRRAGAPSTVTLQCGMDAGTTLEASVHFAQDPADPESRWTPLEDFTAPATGFHDVRFRSEHDGPIPIPAALSVLPISTAVTGWNVVANPTEGVLGRPLDDDPTLRERRDEQLAGAGSATVLAIRSDVSRLDVEKVIVFENDTDAVDGNGLPPHSFECIVWGAAAEDDAIAQAIWDNKGAGIRPFSPPGPGTDSGTATDALGEPHTIAFTRVEEVSLYVTYTLTEREGYVGDDAFKAAVMEQLNEQLGIGDDVVNFDVLVATAGLGALVTAVTFGTAPSPSTSTDVAIGARQIARFDTGRMVIL